ncbi:hypothetical protein [Aeromonas diversa]|uniref:hypothetical protein n=1 Tax=Aeromonas diversa TaxID=502790 RepID=UPI0012693F9A|nr:hypothetical protein [Aeromonas diversa]
MELTNTILSFILTGVIGLYVSNKFQEKSFLHQIKTSRSEREIDRLVEIAKLLEKMSGERIYYSRLLLDTLASSPIKDNGELINQARDEYKKSKDAWNENLNPLFIELYSINMYDCARDIEKNIHNNFRGAHTAIYNLVLNGHSSNLILSGKMHLDIAFTETRRISSEIIKHSNIRWDRIMDGDTEALNALNLNKASSWTLFRALFHKNPSTLRVRRS